MSTQLQSLLLLLIIVGSYSTLGSVLVPHVGSDFMNFGTNRWSCLNCPEVDIPNDANSCLKCPALKPRLWTCNKCHAGGFIYAFSQCPKCENPRSESATSNADDKRWMCSCGAEYPPEVSCSGCNKDVYAMGEHKHNDIDNIQLGYVQKIAKLESERAMFKMKYEKAAEKLAMIPIKKPLGIHYYNKFDKEVGGNVAWTLAKLDIGITNDKYPRLRSSSFKVPPGDYLISLHASPSAQPINGLGISMSCSDTCLTGKRKCSYVDIKGSNLESNSERILCQVEESFKHTVDLKLRVDVDDPQDVIRLNNDMYCKIFVTRK